MIVAYYEKITGMVHTVLQAPGLDSMPQPSATDFGIILANPISLPGYVDGNTYVPLPPSPSAAFQFNWVTKQWEDPRTLDDHKDIKWESIKAARDAAEKSTFVWNGHTIDADMARINGAATGVIIAQAAGQTYEDTWTLADNSTLPVSGADILEMALALVSHVSACHARGRALRQQILDCTTKEQVDAIEWTFP